MFGKLSYLVLLTFSTIIPLFFVLLKYYKNISQYKKVMAVLFLLWLVTGTILNHYARVYGYWSNPTQTTLGIYVFSIPIEDIIASAAIGILLPSITIVLSLKEEKQKK